MVKNVGKVIARDRQISYLRNTCEFCEIVEYLQINAKFTKISNKCEIAQFLRKNWKKYEIYYCSYEFP